MQRLVYVIINKRSFESFMCLDLIILGLHTPITSAKKHFMQADSIIPKQGNGSSTENNPLILRTCCFTSTEARMLIRDGNRRGIGGKVTKE